MKDKKITKIFKEKIFLIVKNIFGQLSASEYTDNNSLIKALIREQEEDIFHYKKELDVLNFEIEEIKNKLSYTKNELNNFASKYEDSLHINNNLKKELSEKNKYLLNCHKTISILEKKLSTSTKANTNHISNLGSIDNDINTCKACGGKGIYCRCSA